MIERAALPPILSAAAIVVAASLASAADLLTPADKLPYQPRTVPHLGLRTDEYHGFRILVGDLDGDGVTELIKGQPGALVGLTARNGRPRVLFQQNFDDDTVPRPGAVYDVNGDGAREILYTVPVGEIGQWRLRAIAPDSGRLWLDAGLPAGPDATQDGRWDGDYTLIGLLPDQPVAVVAAVARKDGLGRGVLAIDLHTGAILWRYAMGPNPIAWSGWIGDLEGDGKTEIVFVANSPGNLGGRLINGTGGYEACVFVLAANGELRWSRVLGGIFTTPFCRVADLDDDGWQEVVTAAQADGAVAGRCGIDIWRGADGTLAARQAVDFDILGLAVGEDGLIAIGGGDGRLRTYFWRGNELETGPTIAGRNPIAVIGSGDILPEPGLEFVTTSGDGSVILLDSQLTPLARHPGPVVVSGTANMAQWTPADDQRYLLVQMSGGRDGLSFLAQGRRRPSRWWWLSLGLLPIAAIAARRWPGRPKPPPPPPPERLIKRDLLQVLLELDHGELRATRALRRLAWLLDQARKQDPVNTMMAGRLVNARADLLESVAPRLEEVLIRAMSCEDLVETAKSMKPIFVALIKQIQGSTDAKLMAELKSIEDDVEKVEAGFKHLRRLLAKFFATDIVELARRLVSLRENDLRRHGIDVHLDVADGTFACIDAADLRFVLENLVGNAIRAMEPAGRGALTVTTRHNGGELVLTVSDDGIGIDPERQERIFAPGASERRDGGLGLHRSKEILARWRGSLELAWSEPGRGSHFEAQLPQTTREEETS
ncbi:MAG: ATP-binding protein [bacterium]